MQELVLKPREGSGGRDLLVSPESSTEEVRDVRQNAKEAPVNFIVQETLDFSIHVLNEGYTDRLLRSPVEPTPANFIVQETPDFSTHVLNE